MPFSRQRKWLNRTLCANETPRAADDDGALWRRILLVPFDVSIPETERDPAVKARLRDPAVGGPAVLAWAVQGCLDWQRDGLKVPDAVRAATRSYRAENDPLADWLEEHTVGIPATAPPTPFSALVKDYREWAHQNGLRPISGKTFGKRLRVAGHVVFEGAGHQRVCGDLGLLLVERPAGEASADGLFTGDEPTD